MTKIRPTLVLLHRYVGLVLAGFLLLTGLTGCLLAWNDELEARVCPELFVVPVPDGARMLDGIELARRVGLQVPEIDIAMVPLTREPGRTVSFRAPPRKDLRTGQPFPLADNQFFVDPYTGEVVGRRKWGELSQGRCNLMPFVYRLHDAVALGRPGRYLLGIVALAWMVDCFVGAWLTFPASPPRRKKGKVGGKPWPARWWMSWKVRRNAGGYKLNHDLHRAGGLWVWAMLFVLAWSSVAFNLREVYNPVMRAVFAHQLDDGVLPPRGQPVRSPALDWAAAREHGRMLMARAARERGFRVDFEDSLAYDDARAVYRYDVHSDLDIRDHAGMTSVYFDADSGRLLAVWVPTGGASGDTIRMWLTSLHMSALGGVPFKVFMVLMGLAVAGLSVTGVVVWWKKRQGRLRHARRQPAAVAADALSPSARG